MPCRKQDTLDHTYWQPWLFWSCLPSSPWGATSKQSLGTAQTSSSLSQPQTIFQLYHYKNIGPSIQVLRPSFLVPRADMTEPSVTRERLILPPSFRRNPVAPVASARSLTNRTYTVRHVPTTVCRHNTFQLNLPSWFDWLFQTADLHKSEPEKKIIIQTETDNRNKVHHRTRVNVMVKMAWERLLTSFIAVDAVTLHMQQRQRPSMNVKLMTTYCMHIFRVHMYCTSDHCLSPSALL